MSDKEVLYRVICIGDDLDGFQKEVEHYLTLGWKLVGGISITLAPQHTIFFAQSIIYDGNQE